MKQKGFTLIEILIALVIFAIIAVISTVGLFAVLKAHDRSKVQVQAMQNMQLAFVIMQQDFGQMVMRQVVDNNGEQLPVFYERANSIEFTRMGYINPLMALQRSTLQRVAYIFADQQLIRRSWSVIDRAPETRYSDRVLLTDLDAVRFNFLGDKNQFFLTWPQPANGTNVPRQLPIGIKIDLSFKKLGNISYLFLIPANGNYL